MKLSHSRLILAFGLVKLLLHFATNTNYGLHRDEFLYFDEGQHLGWGFMEVPPLTPFLALVADWLGGSIFVLRLFPALAGAATIVLAGILVQRLGGGRWAISFACVGLLFSPALLWGNTLFQPVSFNQFFWFLSAFFLVELVRTNSPKYWYLLGVVAGFAILNKYSILFYGLALVVALLLSTHRRWFATRHPYLGLLIALFIALPNILWQFQHDLPVVAHMQDLSATQLVNVEWGGFLASQMLFHIAFNLVWLVGIVGVFFLPKLKPYRFAAWAFIFVVLLIGYLQGKDYYTIGAFTILFPLGGIALEAWLKKGWVKGVVLVICCLLIVPVIPYSLPVLKVDQMVEYCAFMSEKVGLNGPLRWEDGQYYPIPQDMADMHGWDEMVDRVAEFYQSLPEADRENCMLYGGSYGHAGALNYYGEKFGLPEAYSFNSSYFMWLPERVEFDRQIFIDDRIQSESEWFGSIQLIDSTHHPLARDPGYIFYRTQPKRGVVEGWTGLVQEAKTERNF